MSFDNLITIGIIIYVIYSIKKVFSSGKKEGADKKKNTGLAGKLGDFINNVKEEIEKANQQTMAEPSPETEESDNSFWESIREPSQDEPQPDSQPLSQTLFSEVKKKMSRPVVETNVELPEIPEESYRNYPVTLEPAPVSVEKRRRSRYLNMKKSDLKKAVIWSEIISKPISLKE